MEEKRNPLVNTCSMVNVKPIMMDLPYPPVQVRERNPAYANLLSMDYCGSVSEMSAITPYLVIKILPVMFLQAIFFWIYS